MGYTGLVMTDDLDMKAINKDIQTCVSQLLKANIDLALICHEGPNIGIAFKEIQRILETEESLYLAHQASIDRILKYKKRYIRI
jgi:beta-N-acetylhexosaminidase